MLSSILSSILLENDNFHFLKKKIKKQNKKKQATSKRKSIVMRWEASYDLLFGTQDTGRKQRWVLISMSTISHISFWLSTEQEEQEDILYIGHSAMKIISPVQLHPIPCNK